jgi:hypothetical protein
MELSGRHIRIGWLHWQFIPPPIITPRDITVGLMTDAPMRADSQIIIPATQSPIPMMIFNSDLPSGIGPC